MDDTRTTYFIGDDGRYRARPNLVFDAETWMGVLDTLSRFAEDNSLGDADAERVIELMVVDLGSGLRPVGREEFERRIPSSVVTQRRDGAEERVREERAASCKVESTSWDDRWVVWSADGRRNYTVISREGGGWSCTCPDMRHRGNVRCKHVLAVMARGRGTEGEEG